MNLRRDQILDAARELISERGYENLTMRMLAQSAGVTVPTIYNLIGNKEAVLGATIHDGTVRFWQNAELSDDPLTIIETIVSELLHRPEYYQPVLRVLLNGGASTEMAELDGLFLKHLQDTLASMSERGALESWVDAEILGERMLSNLYGAISEWVSGRLSDEALPTAAGYDAAIALAGLTSEKARKTFRSRARKLQKGAIVSERAKARKKLRSSARKRA